MTLTPSNPPYVTLEKNVGETPLECVEKWRANEPALAGVPLAYAGRLDPMASGRLLVLIGDTCKNQESFHNLDKAYTFEILFGVGSDSGDVLGVISEAAERTPEESAVAAAIASTTGEVTLPYPIFSSRTVQGKPLHTWALEGRLSEIIIPTKTSEVYSLTQGKSRRETRAAITAFARAKIASLPPVTDPRKALGNDFRRPLVLESWATFLSKGDADDEFLIVTLQCIASSGTYMRSLAEAIAAKVGTKGLALSIHRDTIGIYDKATLSWRKEF